MCHMNQIVFVDDGNGFLRILHLDTFIQAADDRHQVRNNFFQIADWPFLQCFGQNRVVGVSTYVCHDIAGFLEFNSPFGKETDEFRNDHTWMCIIDLDNSIVCKIVQVTSFTYCFIEDQLCSVADHKILLVDPQFSSGIVAVIRIEE